MQTPQVRLLLVLTDNVLLEPLLDGVLRVQTLAPRIDDDDALYTLVSNRGSGGALWR